MDQCVFCRILAGELPSSPVLDNDLIVLFCAGELLAPGDPASSQVKLTAAQRLLLQLKGNADKTNTFVMGGDDPTEQPQPVIVAHFPVVAQAAASIAGPTHRNMGTLGDNLCLDTRCIFYNQSEWWRSANNHCLKTTGEMCHVAPRSRGVCFATFSGDLAPALMTLEAETELAGPDGRRTLPLGELYIGDARHDGGRNGPGRGDGKRYLALEPGELVVGVRAKAVPGLRSAYDKVRIRRSIEYPVAGVAVALRRDGDILADLRVAITGTNPRPVLLEGTRELCGGPLDGRVFAGLDALVRDQVMSMKTTFTPGHYRRRVAGVLARRLVQRLW